MFITNAQKKKCDVQTSCSSLSSVSMAISLPAPMCLTGAKKVQKQKQHMMIHYYDEIEVSGVHI
jgi:hypothetical protein